ncbi:MAG TPA: alpha/beta hydrolase [Asticcacaulis sp.]|nr:alpha/beta hydrolase [Asticcacaulis sp.]
MVDRRTFLTLSAAFGAAAALPMAARAKASDLSIQDIWPNDPPGGDKVMAEEQVILRHPGGDPNDTAFLHVRKPWLLLRKPKKPNGGAVLLIPGGGYVRVAVSKAGGDIDAWLADQGYTVFTMDYRLPGDPWAAGPEVALQDAQRAMRIIRSRATELKFDPNRVAIMGFSAGGHVAGLLVTRWDKPVYAPIDALDQLSAKPTTASMCYPVVTMMQPYAHQQSMHAALGPDPSEEARQAASIELHVPADAPPTFVCATTNDPVVPHQNAMLMFDALNAAQIPSELHLYEGATHGFPLRGKDHQLLPWGPQALAFMQRHGLDPVKA